MENQLKCFLLLSLKELALRRVAVLLWSGADILESVSKVLFDGLHYYNKAEREAMWRVTIEDKIKDEVLKLDLPESLTKEMIERIRPIGLEVRKWVEGHEQYFYISFGHRIPPDFTKLYWTSAGTINRRKTAVELVRRDDLEIGGRYDLASSYCLEDDIPLLLEELPEWMKEFYKYKYPEPHLSHFWPHILSGDFSELDHLLRTSDRNPFTFYQFAFEHSVENGNKTAAGYFFLKLSHEEREDSLVRAAHNVLAAISNISFHKLLEVESKEKFSRLFFLLSFMNPEQRMGIFTLQPIDVLFSFLEWPYQDLFLVNAGLFWTLLPPDSYSHLLRRMRFRHTKSDFYVPTLFRELILMSPLGFKRCFVDEKPVFNYTCARRFLIELFEYEDSETIGVIFRNLDSADRVKLLFDRDISLELFDCVKKGRWQVVNACLRAATLSMADKERLKGSFMEFVQKIGTREIGRNLERFLRLLDDSDAVAGRVSKRKLEECCSAEQTLSSSGR